MLPKELNIVIFRSCSTVDYFMAELVCKNWRDFIYEEVLTSSQKDKLAVGFCNKDNFGKYAYIKARDLCSSVHAPDWPNEDKYYVKYMPINNIAKHKRSLLGDSRRSINAFTGLLLRYRSLSDLMFLQINLDLDSSYLPYVFWNKSIGVVKWILRCSGLYTKSGIREKDINKIIEAVIVSKKHTFEHLVNLGIISIPSLLDPTNKLNIFDLFACNLAMIGPNGPQYLNYLYDYCINAIMSLKPIDSIESMKSGKTMEPTKPINFARPIKTNWWPLLSSLWLLRKGFILSTSHIVTVRHYESPQWWPDEESYPPGAPYTLKEDIEYYSTIHSKKWFSEEVFYKMVGSYIYHSDTFEDYQEAFINEVIKTEEGKEALIKHFMNYR